MSMISCPKCGEENFPSDRQCLSCGTQLQSAPTPSAPTPAATTPPAVPPAAGKPAAQKKQGSLSRGDLPVYLWIIALLPIGVPILTLGGALWGAIGGGLAAANIQIARNGNMPLGLRITIMGVLTAIAYGLVIPALIAAAKLKGGQ